MSEYNPVERKLAEFLSRYPTVKRNLKSTYQRVNYHLFGDRDFEYKVHPEATLNSVSEWFTTDNVETKRFFGYFDTTPWCPSMEQAIYHEKDGGNEVAVVRYTQGEHTKVTSSSAWNYQQGSRTQWHPNQSGDILFNDIQERKSVTRLINSNGEVKRTYHRPIQAVNPQGGDYLSLSYRRLDRNRPDYGYGTDDGTALPKPEEDGLWLVEFDDGGNELVVPLSVLIDNVEIDSDHEQHYINHALYDPTGEQFAFMHRWRGPEGRSSRLYVTDRSGKLNLLMDENVVSHYCWLDANRLLVWGRSEKFGDGYHVIDTKTGDRRFVHELEHCGDGHPSLSPDGRWIVTDTYPDRSRKRSLLLYDLTQNDVVTLGQFFEPLQYRGTKRCDLHPRWSPDGNAISIDSAHSGVRGSYIIDVSKFVN